MSKYRATFKKKHIILPVVHCETTEQTLYNVQIATHANADGVFLINHSMDYKDLISIYRKVRNKFPDLWIGLNLLGLYPVDVFKVIDIDVNGIWVDNAMINEYTEVQEDANEVIRIQQESGFEGLYFGGFAFKYQRKVLNLELGAKLAMGYMDVITTSGPGTGLSADIKKIEEIKSAIDDFPLAVASGITPDNIKNYLPFADCFLVSTGISRNFTNLDEDKLGALMNEVNSY